MFYAQISNGSVKERNGLFKTLNRLVKIKSLEKRMNREKIPKKE